MIFSMSNVIPLSSFEHLRKTPSQEEVHRAQAQRHINVHEKLMRKLDIAYGAVDDYVNEAIKLGMNPKTQQQLLCNLADYRDLYYQHKEEVRMAKKGQIIQSMFTEYDPGPNAA